MIGETADDAAALAERARQLIPMLNKLACDDPARGLCAAELADCVVRTLALPEIAQLRPTLTPEFSVYSSVPADGVEQATAGIADAISFGPDGKPQIVIDWKSDVQPSQETIDHYRAQVRNYLDMTGAERGLIVLMTSGMVLPVSPSPYRSRG